MFDIEHLLILFRMARPFADHELTHTKLNALRLVSKWTSSTVYSMKLSTSIQLKNRWSISLPKLETA